MAQNASPNSSLIVGIRSGSTAWLIYGGLELVTVAILPWCLTPSYEYKPFSAPASALLLLFYGLLGAAIGLGSVLATRWVPALDVLRLNNIALTAVLLANVLTLWRNWPGSPILLVGSLILVIAANLLSGGIHRFSVLWLPPALYLTWAALGNRFPIALLVTIGLWVLAWFGGGKRIPWSAAAGFAVVCCAVTALLNASPYRDASAPSAPAAAGRPNIVLLSLDTVRADHLSAYGYARKTTPRLEEFGRESQVFTRAVSSGDMTLPSHASIFTGLYPSQHGAHFTKTQRLGAPLDGRFPTLAGLLREQGYWTGGVVANGGYLSIAFGLHRGFNYWDQRLPATTLAPLSPVYLRGRIRDLAVRFTATSEWDRVARSGEEITRSAADALAARPRDGRPFFLFVNYMDAHVPYIPPASYRDLFPGRDPGFSESRYIAAYLDAMQHDRAIGERDRAHLVSQYDAAIRYLDSQVGTLFAQLKSAGLYDNSLIIVTSDHGEALGEHNQLDHGGLSLYQDQIHVPLLIRYPGGQRTGTVDQAAAGVDLMPTVLAAAGLPAPEYLPGRNLAEPIPDGREVLAESFPGGRAYFTNTARFDRTYRGIVSASRKYIGASSGKPELYDLTRDAAETNNLYRAGEPGSVAAGERLSEWTQAILQAARAQQGTRTPGKLDRETVDRLKSLGYVSR
jgi:arylsulfatase A-like enzyme